ncbi:MAG: hypothetical protein GTN65_02360 [Armatimonadetes bacterium]|nr:hypothetical protein [Armatimonadota bacterium]NIO95950.1 hypothetical protein [Armatimonadota bacterium]
MVKSVLYISGASIAVLLTLVSLGSSRLLAIHESRSMSLMESGLAWGCLFLAAMAPFVLMLSATGLALSCWGLTHVSTISPEYKWIILCVTVFLIAVIASCIQIKGILLSLPRAP